MSGTQSQRGAGAPSTAPHGAPRRAPTAVCVVVNQSGHSRRYEKPCVRAASSAPTHTTFASGTSTPRTQPSGTTEAGRARHQSRSVTTTSHWRARRAKGAISGGTRRIEVSS